MILVTGATGFVGRAIVRCLLDAGRPVSALVRARPGLAARARLRAALGAAPDADAVEVVEGDLAAPTVGLSTAALARLRRRVDAVVHCAGDTAFAPPDPRRFVAGHVEGPVALLRALAAGRLTRWMQVSTAFVCGERTGLVRESEGDVGQRFHNAYERAKLDAEAAVRAAGHQTGVAVSVLRPSIVVGDAPATAGGDPSNLFFAFIRLLAGLARWHDAELRIEAAPAAPFNIVPVEYVAGAAATLAADADAGGGTFHLIVRDAPSQARMLTMLVDHLGPRGLTLHDAATAPLTDLSPLERRVQRMLGPYRAYLTQHVRFDDRHAAERLGTLGVAPPTLAIADVRRLVDLALQAPPRAPAIAGADR